MFFAEPQEFDSFLQSAKGNIWSDAFEKVTWLETSNLDRDEPFGFADGISQPQIDWDQQRQTPCTQLEYTDIVALGEFLLGYRNEYRKNYRSAFTGPGRGERGVIARCGCAGEERSGAQRDVSCHATIGTGRPRLLEVSS